jgi:hypothetical protein
MLVLVSEKPPPEQRQPWATRVVQPKIAACTVVEGIVGDESCTDKSACAILEAAAKVGNLSCAAEDACRSISQGTVGNGSCNTESACYGALGVGDASCTHQFACSLQLTLVLLALPWALGLWVTPTVALLRMLVLALRWAMDVLMPSLVR